MPSPKETGILTVAAIRKVKGETQVFFSEKQAPKLAYHMEQPHVSVNGGMAVATFYWSVQLGGRHKIHGRGTHVFAKQGKEWKVVHEHFSRAH